MLWIHLLRVRCEPNKQSGLFDRPRSPSDVIMDAIRSTPRALVGRGAEWRIVKPELIGANAIGFKMGRSAALKVPQYDDKAHDFVESEVQSAPYTFGVYDAETQACGIIKRTGVSLLASQISSKLEKILNSTDFPEQAGCTIQVDPISDPDDFIGQLRGAALVTKFRFTASFPNPFDVERLIQRPAELFTQAAGGDSTTVEVHGQNLDVDLLEELARGVASTGDEAAATVKSSDRARGKRIHLKGNPVQEPVEQERDPKSFYKSILSSTRAAYERIRRFERD